MSANFEPSPSRIGFCSAPWTDCITYADGALKACDRNLASFGNWQEGGLKKTWESEKFQAFRAAIREGRYPDSDCASCHNNGTQRTATSSLVGAYVIHYEFFMRFLNRAKDDHIPELAHLYPLLSTRQRSEISDHALPRFFAYLGRMPAEHPEAWATNKEFRDAVRKLRAIGECLEDYLHGELRPRRVAPFRQSQLQAKCTARCVMCAGKYTGEIVSGPTMGSEYVDEAFAHADDITDFWCNGSEYLFYKDWKKIALMLKEEGVKMRVSTNGILLTEPTIDFLIDNNILGFITLSLDGATKETMESTRVRVNYDKNLQRIRYLLKRATEEKQSFEFTAAFVMMKRNLRELPAFVRLMKSLMPENCKPRVSVLCQPLENFSVEGYRQFVHGEHHVLLGEAELRRLFEETYRASQETGVNVTFYNQTLKDFIAAGMPFPKYFPRQMDIDIFLKAMREGEPLWTPGELDVAALAERTRAFSGAFVHELSNFIRSYFERNAVILETCREFPQFALDTEELVPAYAAALAARYEKETITVKVGEAWFKARKFPLQPVRRGDLVYSAVSGSAGRVERMRSGLALLSDASLVPAGKGLHPLLEPADFTAAPPRALVRARLYLHAHAAKNRLLGNVRSPLLWKVSVAYRRALGVKVAAVER